MESKMELNFNVKWKLEASLTCLETNPKIPGWKVDSGYRMVDTAL